MRLLRYYGHTLLLLLLMQLGVAAQQIPDLINYRVSEYKAHNQNWSISQSADKWMYFANTDGLLSFNGNEWSKCSLENNKIVRSVHCHHNRVYTGAYGEFGYWLRNECGSHVYTSLNSLIPNNEIEKEEIWHILSEGNDVYFQSFSLLMKYDGKKITKIPLPGSVMFLNIVNGHKIIQSIGRGLYEISDNGYLMIDGSGFFANMTVTGIAPLPEESEGYMISTLSNGVFTLKNGKIDVWNRKFQNYLIESQVNKSFLTKDSLVIFGTIRDGLLVFNSDRTLKYHIQSANGLQNNTILALSQDSDGHLWVGLDKGISHVKMDENVLYYKDESGTLGTVYSMCIHEGMLYLGTNQGVYYAISDKKNLQQQNSKFKLVKGTQGQVWELKKIGNILLCGHNEGTFIIEGASSTKISEVTGGWFTQEVNAKDDYLIQGTYTGVIFFKRSNTGYKFSHKLIGYNEPVKKIIQESPYQFWVTGPNSGLSLLTLDNDYIKVINAKKITNKHGLKNHQNLDVNSLNGRLLLFDGHKHYSYDAKKDQFSLDTMFNKENRDYLLRIINNNCFAKIYKDSMVIVYANGTTQSHRASVNRDYHSLSLLDSNTVGICLNEGYSVVRLSNKTKPNRTLQKILFYKISFNSDSNCISIDDKTIEIDFLDNSFKVYFYDTEFLASKQYWFRLLPFDNEWKALNGQEFVEFSNLSSGKYTLEIKSNQSVSKLNLQILPPWYKQNMFLALYLILLACLFWLLKLYFNKQLAIQKEKLESENARIFREGMIEMENKRLIQDNLTKSKELANATMHLIQKNELLQEIKEELIEIRKSGDQILTTKDFQIMMKQINENLTVKDDKKLFNESFEDVHDAFFKKLKQEFPELTNDDLKLAAYLKMNLSSKDIAPLFNISIRGLENKRYRLRKKMELPTDTDLTWFFTNYLV